jgi:hypothetical protein
MSIVLVWAFWTLLLLVFVATLSTWAIVWFDYPSRYCQLLNYDRMSRGEALRSKASNTANGPACHATRIFSCGGGPMSVPCYVHMCRVLAGARSDSLTVLHLMTPYVKIILQSPSARGRASGGPRACSR